MTLQQRSWQIAMAGVVVIWVALVVAQMTADVWDETNGMLLFGAGTMGLGEKLRFALTESLGFWRPLPTLLAAVVLHAVPFEISWLVMRAINAAMLLVTLALMLITLRSSAAAGPVGAEEEPRRLLLAVAFLFSGSALITAGWYANVFDASALLLIAAGVLLLIRGRDLAAGLTIGAAFFCKETAILALPFLLMLLAAGRVSLRQAIRAGAPAALVGAAYFAIRSQIVPFGSEADIHGFAWSELRPTIVNLSESLWRQTLKATGPGILGFVWLGVALAALRKPKLIAATLLLLAGTGLIYWGMFSEWQNGVLLHHLNFVGRLYLVPVALMLLILAMERRLLAIGILCLPILLGAWTTWRDHRHFQETYSRIYRVAGETDEPVTVHYPAKPLEDTVRGVRIGDHPDARIRVAPRTGELLGMTDTGHSR